MRTGKEFIEKLYSENKIQEVNNQKLYTVTDENLQKLLIKTYSDSLYYDQKEFISKGIIVPLAFTTGIGLGAVPYVQSVRSQLNQINSAPTKKVEMRAPQQTRSTSQQTTNTIDFNSLTPVTDSIDFVSPYTSPKEARTMRRDSIQAARHYKKCTARHERALRRDSMQTVRANKALARQEAKQLRTTQRQENKAARLAQKSVKLGINKNTGRPQTGLAMNASKPANFNMGGK